MPTLFLKCRKCEAVFPTPIAVTEAGLQGVMITGLRHRCPACGSEDDYSTHDYFVPKVERPEDAGAAELGESPAAQAEAQHDADVSRLEGFGVRRPSHAERTSPPNPPSEAA